MFILYYSPGACSLAVHIALRHLDLDYELRPVGIETGGNRSADFRALNPHERVPVLLGSGGALTEVVAILQHLADLHPAQALLAPPASMHRARAMEWMSFLASTLHPLYWGVWRPERLSSEATQHGTIRATAETSLTHYYRLIEARLPEQGFLLGSAPCAADFHLFVFGRWGRVLPVPTGSLPRFRHFMERMLDVPAVAAAVQAEAIQVF